VSGEQENVGALNPNLLAKVEAAIKEQPDFGVLRTTTFN
jgi:hypothetical protein